VGCQGLVYKKKAGKAPINGTYPANKD